MYIKALLFWATFISTCVNIHAAEQWFYCMLAHKEIYDLHGPLF